MNQRKARIVIDHMGCFSQFQKEFPGMTELDINLAKPGRYKDKEVLAGYLVLRGCTEDKKKFYELCRSHGSEAMVLVSLKLVTDFVTEPTILSYDMMEVAKPSVTSLLYSSEVEYPWPLVIRIANGLEKIMVQGDEKSIEEFRENVEKQGIGTIELEYVDENAFRDELQAMEFDKDLILGFYILEILRESLRSNVLDQNHSALLERVLVDPEAESLREMSESYKLSYGAARQIVGRVRKQISRDLTSVFQAVLSDLKKTSL
ncbi:hypothetical protein ACFL6S_05175 [Candidatus Poribacteria bacterium]